MVIYRRYEPEYSSSIADLLYQLGYKVDESEITDRIEAISENEKGIVFTAELNCKIVGCVHAMIVSRLAEGTCGEIVSLVVEDSCRGNGIGKGLLDEATNWLKSKGQTKVRIRCNTIREEAHKFYSHLGYKEKKSQTDFEKNI